MQGVFVETRPLARKRPSIAPNHKKFYSIFFKKSRRPEAAPLVSGRSQRNPPYVSKRHPQMAQSPGLSPTAPWPHRHPCGGGRRGHLFRLAQGPASLTAPDGIRSGRVKDAVSYQLGTHSPRHGDHRFPNPHGRTAPYGLRGGYVIGRGTRHKAAVHHPLTGCGRRPSALPGIAPSADGALGRRGVSPAAAGGYFAPCAARVFRPLRRATGALPLDPRIFSRKNSVKAFDFGCNGYWERRSATAAAVAQSMACSVTISASYRCH